VVGGSVSKTKIESGNVWTADISMSDAQQLVVDTIDYKYQGQALFWILNTQENAPIFKRR